MAKRKLVRKLNAKKAVQKREEKRDERHSHAQRAIQARWTKKNQPNTELKETQGAGDEPTTSAAVAEDIADSIAASSVPASSLDLGVPTMEHFDFDEPIPSTSAAPMDTEDNDEPMASTSAWPMDFHEPFLPTTPIDDRFEHIEQLEKQLKEQDDVIKLLREQVRNREALIACLRRQLVQNKSPRPTTPTGRPKKNIDLLQRTSRRKLADKIAEVIDRDTSRSASRCSLESVHREVRHRFQHFTPQKNQNEIHSQSMDPKDALLILGLVGTQKAYVRMKQTLRLIGLVFDCLPPLKKVLVIKRRICNPLRYDKVETQNGAGFVCSDITAALEFRLSSAKNNLINFGNNIFLKISGDYGQGFTKITISFGQALRSNSPSNNLIVAVFPAKDSRSNLEQFCKTLWVQVSQIATLTGKQIQWLLGGDVSFVWSMIGHCGSAVTSFPSPLCNCHREELAINETNCQLRTIQKTIEQAEQFSNAMENGMKANAAIRSTTMGITRSPLLPNIEFDRVIPAPFHVFQGLGNALVRELEVQEGCEAIIQQFLRRIGARREQFRKKDLTGNSIRKILAHAHGMEDLFETEWPKNICKTLTFLGKIQNFTKAQPLSPNELHALEQQIEELREFLNEQPKMRDFLSLKPKAHLLLMHFVPFARQHNFLGLLDEQGDEALHSVWRRLEQLWKCMPDDEQIRQQLEHHFVNNWLLDTGRFDEMKQARWDEQNANDNISGESDVDMDQENFVDVTG